MEDAFVYEETVRIYDTDAQGVVHYAGYYRFFTDALEQFANQRTGRIFPLVNDKVWFVVVESNAKYYKSARTGDRLKINLLPSQLSEKALRFDFRIKRDDDLICEGYIVQVAIDKTKWKSVQIPGEIIDALFQKKS
jgi:acyl-CoA thioester hydrolase